MAGTRDPEVEEDLTEEEGVGLVETSHPVVTLEKRVTPTTRWMKHLKVEVLRMCQLKEGMASLKTSETSTLAAETLIPDETSVAAGVMQSAVVGGGWMGTDPAEEWMDHVVLGTEVVDDLTVGLTWTWTEDAAAPSERTLTAEPETEAGATAVMNSEALERVFLEMRPLVFCQLQQPRRKRTKIHDLCSRRTMTPRETETGEVIQLVETEKTETEGGMTDTAGVRTGGEAVTEVQTETVIHAGVTENETAASAGTARETGTRSAIAHQLPETKTPAPRTQSPRTPTPKSPRMERRKLRKSLERLIRNRMSKRSLTRSLLSQKASTCM